MTLYDLLEFSPAQVEILEKLSHDELNAICSPYWNITRPSLVVEKKSEAVNKPKPFNKEKYNKQKTIDMVKAELLKLGHKV